MLFALFRGGAPGRIRTCDTRFRKPMLYPLSYEGGRGDRSRSGSVVGAVVPVGERAWWSRRAPRAGPRTRRTKPALPCV